MMNIFGKKKKVSTPVERKEILDSLLNAAQYGNHELVLKILQQGSFIVNGTDENGKSSLHIACLNSHLKTAQVLTSFGADVNQSDENGWTPLHCATTSRNSELILHVLNNEEIKVNVSNGDNNTPLHYLAKNPCEPSNTLSNIVAIFVNKGANVNAFNVNGETPLHNASFKGYWRMVEILLKYKSDINARNDHGETPLHYAARMSHERCVELLLKAGADSTLEGEDGKAIDVADQKNEGVINLLRNWPNVKLSSNSTTPHLSPRTGSPTQLSTVVTISGNVSRPKSMPPPIGQSLGTQGSPRMLTVGSNPNISFGSNPNLSFEYPKSLSSSNLLSLPDLPSLHLRSPREVSSNSSSSSSVSTPRSPTVGSPRERKSTPITSPSTGTTSGSPRHYSSPAQPTGLTIQVLNNSDTSSKIPASPRSPAELNLEHSNSRNRNRLSLSDMRRKTVASTDEANDSAKTSLRLSPEPFLRPSNSHFVPINASPPFMTDIGAELSAPWINALKIRKEVKRARKRASRRTMPVPPGQSIYTTDQLKALVNHSANDLYSFIRIPVKYLSSGTNKPNPEALNPFQRKDWDKLCYDITFYDEQSLVILSDSNWEQILQEASSDIKFGEDLIAEEQIGQRNLSDLITKYFEEIGESKHQLLIYLSRFLSGRSKLCWHFLTENFTFQLYPKFRPGNLPLEMLISKLIDQERFTEAAECLEYTKNELKFQQRSDLYIKAKQEDRLVDAIEIKKEIELLKKKIELCAHNVVKWQSDDPPDDHITLAKMRRKVTIMFGEAKATPFLLKYGVLDIGIIARSDIQKAIDIKSKAKSAMAKLMEDEGLLQKTETLITAVSPMSSQLTIRDAKASNEIYSNEEKDQTVRIDDIEASLNESEGEEEEQDDEEVMAARERVRREEEERWRREAEEKKKKKQEKKARQMEVTLLLQTEDQ